MDESIDLRKVLDGWEYDPDEPVRVTRLGDGREVLQVRLPLGIEQYELDGRPDGKRPGGKESVLSYHLSRLGRAKAAGVSDAFRLTPDECDELFDEGVLYYYRYLHFFQLEDWERTVRDTGRNLKLFNFVKRHAKREEDRVHLEQWRPYVTRMYAVSSAMLELKEERHGKALEIVKRAISQIETMAGIEHPTFSFERDRSLEALREMAGHIDQSRPLAEVERLERQLLKAVEVENFELAAELRDRIKQLREQPSERTAPTSA